MPKKIKIIVPTQKQLRESALVKIAFEDGQYSGWAEVFAKTSFWLRIFFPRDIIQKMELKGKEIEKRFGK
jgi:hypothetical protein